MRILFSPVGYSDPLSIDMDSPIRYDGPMIHALRMLRPDKVCLYFTKDIWELQLKDQRYTLAIARLAEDLDCSFETLLYQSQIDKITNYQSFYDEFKRIIQEIIEENQPTEIFANISSGTPAIKATLNTLSEFLECNLQLVQTTVNTTNMNIRRGKIVDFDIKQEWDNNKNRIEDNIPAINQTFKIVRDAGLYNLILRENIKILLDNYDYDAIATLIAHQPEFQQVKPLIIKAIQARGDATKKIDAEILWLDNMQIDYRMGHLRDLLIRLSPILEKLFIRFFEKKTGISMAEILIYNERSYDEFNLDKMATMTSDLAKISKILNKKLKDKKKSFQRASTNTLNYLVAECSSLDWKKEDLAKELNKLRKVEEVVRNQVAHYMEPLTETVIQKKTGESSEAILQRVIRVYNELYADQKLETNYFDELTREIKELL